MGLVRSILGSAALSDVQYIMQTISLTLVHLETIV